MTMRIGISAYDIGARDLVDLAGAADELGFESLWLGEHVVLPVDYRSEHATSGTAGHHHKFPFWRTHPSRVDRGSKVISLHKFPATRSVHSDKFRIAEFAYGLRSVDLTPGPKVAARKTTKYCRAPGIGAFTLQRVEDFFDRIRHVFPPTGGRTNCQLAY